MATVALGDERLDKRAIQLLDRMIAQPSTSLPTACRGWAETQAAYRFFDHEKVTSENILAAHHTATTERMAHHRVVLCAQDTTELNYSGQNKIQGLGPLTLEAHRGLLLHPTLAITPDRLCLGVLAAHMWARREDTYGKSKDRSGKAIEEKESYRWIEGYRQVSQLSHSLPQTQCVYMADREGDIYDLFVECENQQTGADYLIRVCHDRAVLDDSRLSEQLTCAPTLGKITFDLPSSHTRKRKSVTQSIKAIRVNLQAPNRKSQLPALDVTVVMAQELNPPKGEKPITWMLVTNLEVITLEQAMEKIRWYLCRWQIEIFFRILKSGCKVEKLQLERADRLRPAVAMYMIVAWRVLYLTMLGRECPQIPCDLVFDTDEWQAIYLVTTHQTPPRTPPGLNTIVHMVACFGGFLDRKGDGEPGPQTLWIGMQRARDFVTAIDASNSARAT